MKITRGNLLKAEEQQEDIVKVTRGNLQEVEKQQEDTADRK